MELNSGWLSKGRRVSAAESFPRPMMTPIATRATHSDAANVPGPIGHLLHARRVPNKTPADAV